MPKRKRGAYEDGGARTPLRRKSDVEEKVTEGRKVLHKALKAAKGFERQRLGKRLTNARTQGKDSDVQRINKEIEILKGLDLGKVGEAHLRKTILKVKAFAESDLLPRDMKTEVEKPDMGEEHLKAWNNVLSGMFNMKPVKEAMSKIIAGLYNALGVPAPTGKQTGKEKKLPEKDILEDNPKPSDSAEDVDADSASDEEDIPDGVAWEGFDSGDDHIPDVEAEDAGSDEDLDEEELSRYDALLGGSSDEESFDEEQYKSKRTPNNNTERLSLSLSPTPDAESEPESISSPPPKAIKESKSKPAPAKIGGSTFLPTLMGGYYEGSDSSASDIDEGIVKDKPVKKNRPGQMARQAIWEKKYGKGANHMKKGLGSVAERTGKDDGWDAKRGAKDGDRRGRGGPERGRAPAVRGTMENSMPLGERKRGAGKKDDAGVLHPSWQAAKKAKEMTKTATFQGKKVVFG